MSPTPNVTGDAASASVVTTSGDSDGIDEVLRAAAAGGGGGARCRASAGCANVHWGFLGTDRVIRIRLPVTKLPAQVWLFLPP